MDCIFTAWTFGLSAQELAAFGNIDAKKNVQAKAESQRIPVPCVIPSNNFY